ncbi:hypothetical protein AAC387_Pa06g1221 [Persea americana]
MFQSVNSNSPRLQEPSLLIFAQLSQYISENLIPHLATLHSISLKQHPHHHLPSLPFSLSIRSLHCPPPSPSPAPFASISNSPSPWRDAHHPAQPISLTTIFIFLFQTGLHLHLSAGRTHAAGPRTPAVPSPSSSASHDASLVGGTLPFPLCNTAAPTAHHPLPLSPLASYLLPLPAIPLSLSPFPLSLLLSSLPPLSLRSPSLPSRPRPFSSLALLSSSPSLSLPLYTPTLLSLSLLSPPHSPFFALLFSWPAPVVAHTSAPPTLFCSPLCNPSPLSLSPLSPH